MKWFKHLSTMRHDPKVKRLTRKYGSDGWTVYTVIVESIAESLDPITQILPVLQETSEDIAYEFNIDSRRVEEILGFCERQGLIEVDENGIVFCFKLYNYADEYFTKTQKNKEIYTARNKEIVNAYKQNGVTEAVKVILQHVPSHIGILYSIGTDYGVSPELLQSMYNKSPKVHRGNGKNGHSQNSRVTPDLLPQDQTTPDYIRPKDISVPAPNPIRDLKDDLANYYQELFISLQPASTWSNIGREKKTCNDLSKKTRVLIADIAPDFNEIEMAELLVSELKKKQMYATNDYWKNVKLCPSGFLSRWTEIVQMASKRFQENQKADELDMGGFYDEENF